jgi:anti-sigma B factor antagonist
MNVVPGKLKVLTGDDFACVRISGRANFTMGMDFQSLLAEVQKRNYHYVVMDLSECMLMDSTFLGILTGFGLKMAQTNGDSKPHVVELMNPNSRVSELIENMGVMRLFRLHEGVHKTPQCEEQQLSSSSPASQQQLTRSCLEAHQILMSLNAENAARFKDVAQFLAEELKKSKRVE